MAWAHTEPENRDGPGGDPNALALPRNPAPSAVRGASVTTFPKRAPPLRVGTAPSGALAEDRLAANRKHCVLSALLMFERFVKALKIAVRDEGFAQIPRNRLLLVIIGTLTYTTTQDWSLVDGFYFAVATRTTSSIADPDLTITGAPIKIFTVFYVLVGIGILVELARQLGCLIEVRRAEAAKAAKGEHAAGT